MALNPELAAFLELAEGSTPLHELPIEHARAAYEKASQALDALELEAHAVLARDLDLGRDLRARLYRPHDAEGALPVLLYFHGGGYTVGSLDSHDSLCRAIAWRTPCAVLAIDYRRAPEHRFPAAFEDALHAYEWLLECGAERLGVDTHRIAVGGDSVGGTLATALCIAARDADLPPPLLQALLYPCTGSHQDEASHRRLASGYLLEAETLQWMFGNYLRNVADREDWRFAPLRATSLVGLPPAFIALAEYDPLVDEGRAYAERLATAGVITTLSVYPGMVHDFARLGNIVPTETQALRQAFAQALSKEFS